MWNSGVLKGKCKCTATICIVVILNFYHRIIYYVDLLKKVILQTKFLILCYTNNLKIY